MPACATNFNKAQPQEQLAHDWQKRAGDTLAMAHARTPSVVLILAGGSGSRRPV